MQNEDGVKLSETEIMKSAMDHLAEACCFLFELESPTGEAAGYMADTLLKYCTVVINGDSPRAATCDYTAYEEKLLNRKNFVERRLRVINSELGI